MLPHNIRSAIELFVVVFFLSNIKVNELVFSLFSWLKNDLFTPIDRCLSLRPQVAGQVNIVNCKNNCKVWNYICISNLAIYYCDNPRSVFYSSCI